MYDFYADLRRYRNKVMGKSVKDTLIYIQKYSDCIVLSFADNNPRSVYHNVVGCILRILSIVQRSMR